MGLLCCNLLAPWLLAFSSIGTNWIPCHSSTISCCWSTRTSSNGWEVQQLVVAVGGWWFESWRSTRRCLWISTRRKCTDSTERLNLGTRKSWPLRLTIQITKTKASLTPHNENCSDDATIDSWATNLHCKKEREIVNYTLYRRKTLHSTVLSIDYGALGVSEELLEY